MKIQDMPSKENLEVQDTDLLVIEDIEDTKKITIKDLKEYLMKDEGIENKVKRYINNAIDNIVTALNESKLKIKETITYLLDVDILDDSGDINFKIKNQETDTYLTKEEIGKLTESIYDEEGNEIKRELKFYIIIDDIIYKSTNYTLNDSIIVDDNSTALLVHFDALECKTNDISSITKNSIKVFIIDDENNKYKFVIYDSMFNNNVPFTSNITSYSI